MTEEKKILRIEDMCGNAIYLGWESVSEVWSLETVLKYRLSYISGSNFKHFYKEVIRAVAEMSGDANTDIYNIVNRLPGKSDDVCCMFMLEKALFDVQLKRQIQFIKKDVDVNAEQHCTKAIDLKSAVERLYENLGALEFGAYHKAIYGKEKYYTVEQCEQLRVKYKIERKDFQRTAEWQKNCGNSNVVLMDISELSNKLICEKHFIPTDININNKRKLLNKNAVPVKYVEPIISIQGTIKTYGRKRKTHVKENTENSSEEDEETLDILVHSSEAEEEEKKEREKREREKKKRERREREREREREKREREEREREERERREREREIEEEEEREIEEEEEREIEEEEERERERERERREREKKKREREIEEEEEREREKKKRERDRGGRGEGEEEEEREIEEEEEREREREREKREREERERERYTRKNKGERLTSEMREVSRRTKICHYDTTKACLAAALNRKG
ncbi:hypothetical protein FQA39_LY02482 [Lamprigera yunnana]|nr:hypothetical protein FQA39_LY02482 [Lamprigera yunnana]